MCSHRPLDIGSEKKKRETEKAAKQGWERERPKKVGPREMPYSGVRSMFQPKCTSFEAVCGTVSMTALFLCILTFRVGHVAGFVPSLGVRATCHNSLCVVPSSRLWGTAESQVEAINTGGRLNNPPGKLLVHWRSVR